MKKTLLLFSIFLLLFSSSAFSLNNFYYTGIAFDGSSSVLASTTVNVEIELIESALSKYKETHSGVTTDQFGTYIVEVGSGIVVSGNLSTTAASKDLKIKSTVNNGGASGVWVISSIIKPTVAITGGSNNLYWQLNGNSGTTAGIHFLGTTDNTELELKVQNSAATYFNSISLGNVKEI
jgi:hypothetical protein